MDLDNDSATDVMATYNENTGNLTINSDIKVVEGVLRRVTPGEPICIDAGGGFGIPAISQEDRDSIINPKDGIVIFNTTVARINGYFNNRWNDIVGREILLLASSFNNQQPDAQDEPLQIEFGEAQGSGGDPVQLSVDGTITFNQSGFYLVTFTIQYGRITNPLNALIHFRTLLNGTQVGNTASATLPTANSDTPFSATAVFEVEAGDEITAEVIRDSEGANEGGLVSVEVSAEGWSDSPSAAVRVTR